MSREKQIEEMAECLIDIQQKFNEYCAKPCRECELGGIVNCENHYKAETLYNAGYRKQSERDNVEWISVDDRLPEESGEYLTYHNGYYMTLSYSARHKMFNASDDLAKANSAVLTVTHWMPLPEPPLMERGAV